MVTAHQRSHVSRTAAPHATRGEDLTETAFIESKGAHLTETDSMVHRNLERVEGILGSHDLLEWQKTLTVSIRK
jgi:hypothetical protein